MDKKMKHLFIYYAISALCATLIVSGTILSYRYLTSLSDTLGQLQTIRTNSAKMRGAVKEIDKTTARLASMMPANYKREEMEARTLAAIDAIKDRMKGVNVTLGTFTVKETEVALPITLAGAIDDYATFVNNIGHLQSMISPFMLIDGISMSKSPSEAMEGLTFEIRGVLKIQSYSTGGKS